MKKCTCKLKLKKGEGVIRTSAFVSKPIHLGLISDAEYSFYADFFPDAFEVDCTCKKEEKKEDDSYDRVKKQVKSYTSKAKKKK